MYKIFIGPFEAAVKRKDSKYVHGKPFAYTLSDFKVRISKTRDFKTVLSKLLQWHRRYVLPVLIEVVVHVFRSNSGYYFGPESRTGLELRAREKTYYIQKSFYKTRV